MDLDELLARESIRDLVARYNANGDSGRFDDLLALFAPDAVMELVSMDGTIRTFEGVGEIATIFTGTKDLWDAARAAKPAGAAASRGAAAPGASRHHVRHFVGTHQIDVADANHASGRSYFLVLFPHGLDHWGRYIDRYERRDGRWRIVRRRAVTDGRSPRSITAEA